MKIKKYIDWDNKKKKWIFPLPFSIIGEVTVFDMLKQYSIKDFDNIEITEFTGMADKNDKDIYEKDIVRFEGKNYIVEWSDQDILYWCLRSKEDGELALAKCHKDNYEVIGNVYEEGVVMDL